MPTISINKDNVILIAQFRYLVLPDGMGDDVPLSGLQSLIGHRLKPRPHTVVAGSLHVYRYKIKCTLSPVIA
jgi:hypothetical protein